MPVEYDVAVPRKPVATRRPRGADEHVLARIRCEYREMPGLCLTTVQARRLFSLFDLDLPLCEALLNRLVSEGFLHRSSAGVYYLASTV